MATKLLMTLGCCACIAVLAPFPAFAANESGSDTTSKPPAIVVNDHAGATSYSIEKIVEAFRQREERFRSAVFDWTEHRVLSQSLLAEDESLAESPEPEYDVTSRLSFDRNLVRYTFKKSIWTDGAPEGGDQYVGVFNGKESKVYFPPGYVADYPRGHVSSQQQSEELTASYIKPFLWEFRISAPRVMLFPVSEATLLRESAEIDGRECLALNYSGTPGHKDTIWVDPRQDFSIVRHTTSVDDRLIFQFDMEYRRDEMHKAWVPQTWRFVTMGTGGMPQISVNGKLTSYSLNTALPAGEFEFAFPPGTWVHDGSNTEYIVSKDGPNRPVAVSERRVSYRELLREPRISSAAAQWLFWCNLVVLLGICAFLLVRWQNWKRTIPH